MARKTKTVERLISAAPMDYAAKFASRHSAGDGCWLWASTTNDCGYGLFFANGGGVLGHRASYIIHVGPIPEGLQILHQCDVRACVNPAHLFLGTATDNMRDRTLKGRSARHEKNGRAVLTWQQVTEIRARRAEGTSNYKLAAAYGVSETQIRHIVTGRQWRAA